MNFADAKVPVSILLNRSLADSAKLLWLILQLDAPLEQTPVSLGLLQARSGLARHTVMRGLARLESAGWLSETMADSLTAPHGTALMPRDLLLDKHVRVQAKLLYGSLQVTPGFRGAMGQFTYSELTGLVGLSQKPVRAAVRELQEQGWLQVSQQNKFSPIHFVLRNPTAARRDGDVIEARQRLNEAPFIGEALIASTCL